MKESFIFYKSFYDGIKMLDDKDQLQAFKALCEYAFYNEEVPVDGVAGAIFALARPQIDANNERYENGKKGGKYGKLGGRPKKAQTDAPTEEKPKKPAKVEDPKLSYGEFGNVKLTAAEHDKLIAKYGSDETAEAIEFLDQYISEKGYKSKSHYLAMCRWVFDAVTERKNKKTTRIDDDCAFDKLFKEAGLMA